MTFTISNSKTLIGAAVALTLLAAQAVHAAPIHLSYSGVGSPGNWWSSANASGFGSFETNSGNYSGSIALQDLKSFSFNLQIELDGEVELYRYSLGDLDKFSATIGAGGFTSLMLRTDFVMGEPRGWQGLNFLGLGADQARTHHSDIPGPFTIGQLSASDPGNHVPEPASLALTVAALGLAGLVGRGSRRKA